MRTAKIGPPTRRPVSRTATLPAPVGGWNARDAIAAMPPTDAVTMINFFPRTSDVVMRNGFSSFATGMSGSIETLMDYDGGTGSTKMFAANAGKFYDVSSSGAVGAAVATGFTSNRWQYTKFGTPAGQFLVAVNGADTPQQYNGTAWSNSTITAVGLTPSNLIHVNAYEQRLFFAEKGKLGFWYLPVTQVTGTVTYFDLSSLFTLGGYLQAIATWSVDGGSGLQNNICFITSRGQVAVYNGTDPSSASLWSLVGIYRIGIPIGRRCFQQYGGDLLIVTTDGVYPLSQALITARATPKAAVTDKISRAFTDIAATSSGFFGWQIVLYPRGTYILVNIPTQEDGNSVQYVMNTITDAWCQFNDINTSCWELHDDRLYFGGNDGVVYLSDDGASDGASVITAEVLPAFSDFGAPGLRKLFTMIRPVWLAGGTVSPAINMNIDYDTLTKPTSIPISSGGGGTPWYSPWYSPWSGAYQTRTNQIGVTGIGYTASAHLLVSSMTQKIALLSNDYTFQIGAQL